MSDRDRRRDPQAAAVAGEDRADLGAAEPPGLLELLAVDADILIDGRGLAGDHELRREGPGLRAAVAHRVAGHPGLLEDLATEEPGEGVLARVVQLELARTQALARWPELGELRKVRRLKFLRPLRPGERAILTLERRAEDRVEFLLAAPTEAGDDRISVGSLMFAAGA